MPFVFIEGPQNLSELYKKRAKNELHEDPRQTDAHLTSYRRWISSMPHLHCPADDTFLLAFLRHAKFNHSKAQRSLDNFCTLRTSESEGCLPWFTVRDTDFSDFKKFLDMKFSAPLGFTENGSFMVIVKLANFVDDSFPFEEMYRITQVFYDVMILDERCQIGGFGFIIDYTGTTMKQAKAMFSPKDIKLQSKYYQEALPLRISKMFFYNIPSFFEGLMKVVTYYANEKMRSKYVVIESNFDAAFDSTPGLKEIMPKEYGGNNKSYDELFDEHRKVTEEMFLSHKPIQITVDETKRPAKARNLMSVYKDIPADLMGTPGTYVKLSDEI